MSIWYHFEVISHSTVCLLSNLFNYHGLIKSKFIRLLVNHTLIAYQRSDSIGEYLWDDFRGGGEMSMGQLQWVQIFCETHQIHKYDRSLHTSIISATMGRPVETGRKLKANTVQ